MDLRDVLAEKNVPLGTAETSWSHSSDLMFRGLIESFLSVAESRKTDIVSSDRQRKENFS